MITCFEAHLTCIVFLVYLRFVFFSILSNFAETSIICIGFKENAVSWCRWSSIVRFFCSIYLLLEGSFYIPLEIIISGLLISKRAYLLIRFGRFDCSMVQVQVSRCRFTITAFIWASLFANVLRDLLYAD